MKKILTNKPPMKKIAILMVLGIFIGSTATLATTQLFNDLPENQWYTQAVKNLTAKGIIEGYDNNTFRPENDVNRAELAVILDRLITYMDTQQAETPVTPAPVIDEKMDDQAFKHDEKLGYFGTITLKGHLDIERPECPQGGTCQETVDYASLVFDTVNNTAFNEYVKESEGNAFIGVNSIGLGCYTEVSTNRIYSMNESDYGQVENMITDEDLTKLLASKDGAEIQIQVTKPILTAGAGAPDCYSHFRNMDVL